MSESAQEIGLLPAASGSSFYTAMRILPRERREGMFAVYGFCRAVDDIADEGGTDDEKRAGLNAWRRDIDNLFRGKPAGRAAFLAEATNRYDLRRQDFHAVIDGMEMDVGAGIVAPDWATLDLYCDRVASAVGRLSTPVFGMDSVSGEDLSYHLGRALQLTNILRDIDEDAAIGRLYMPREELEKVGLDPKAWSITALLDDPRIDQVARAVANRAEAHFVEAETIMATAPRTAVRAPRIMGSVYRGILARLLMRGWRAPRTRVRAGKFRIIGAVLKYGVI